MIDVWVAILVVSDRVDQKIVHRYGISADEVRDAVVCVSGLPGRWDEHPQRGRRVLIDVQLRARLATVVLYPAEHPLEDAWNLGSVYFVD